jgi:hypothetical protein
MKIAASLLIMLLAHRSLGEGGLTVATLLPAGAQTRLRVLISVDMEGVRNGHRRSTWADGF